MASEVIWGQKQPLKAKCLMRESKPRPLVQPQTNAGSVGAVHSLRDAEATERPSSVYGYVTLL